MENLIKTFAETEFYGIKINETLSTNKLYWKDNHNLDLSEFKKGILEFANLCKETKPKRAVIDARKLDLKGNPFLWVSGQKKIEGVEDYNPWFEREVAPLYNKAGILGLGVATGDPSAPGELLYTPEGVNFKIGYFTTFDDTLNWKLD